MPIALPVWLPGGGAGGGEVVGSEKFGNPWERMHFARLSKACFSLADPAARLLPPPFRNCAHAFWADLNAGACGLIQLGMTLGPPGLGSGKFGTPCDRMHRASLSGPLAAEALLKFIAAPQAAAVSAKPAMANVTLSRSAATIRLVIPVIVSRIGQAVTAA